MIKMAATGSGFRQAINKCRDAGLGEMAVELIMQGIRLRVTTQALGAIDNRNVRPLFGRPGKDFALVLDIE